MNELAQQFFDDALDYFACFDEDLPAIERSQLFFNARKSALALRDKAEEETTLNSTIFNAFKPSSTSSTSASLSD